MKILAFHFASGGIGEYHGDFASGSFLPWNIFSFFALSKTYVISCLFLSGKARYLLSDDQPFTLQVPRERVHLVSSVACRAPKSLFKLFLGLFLLPERILGGLK